MDYMKTVSDKEDAFLSNKPEEPLDSDCCGNGCCPCVFDIYQEELKIWQKECEKLKKGQYKFNTVAVKPDDYICLKLISVYDETENCKRYRFELPEHVSLSLTLGQHLILRQTYDTATITRQYTPVTHTSRYFEVLIKIYPNGKMSRVVKSWKVGDYTEWRGPFGGLSYTPSKYKKVLCVAAGTGIAPIIQVIRCILDNEDDESRIRLLYSIPTYTSILMKPQLDEWASFWNFSSLYFLTKETADNEVQYRYGDMVRHGYLTRDIITSEIQSDIQHTLVLICGTKSFDRDMLEYVRMSGISEINIHRF